MEPSSSADDGMDTKFASSRCKAKKAVLNRRPSGYWKVFSNWWRGRYAALKTRPTVHEVIDWYHRNAASSWPVGQVPCLKAVLRQSKGLRPIDGLKEYFREYRKKRKQQGGLALKATDDGSGRRARPAKRRRGRAAQRDSSDEEEEEEQLENETSGLSDHMASDDDDEVEADVGPQQDATQPQQLNPQPHSALAPAGCTGQGFPSDGLGLVADHMVSSAAHAIFTSWQQGGCAEPAAMVGLEAGPSSSLAVGMMPVLHMDGCAPAGDALDAAAAGAAAGPLSFPQLPSTVSASGDQVHPSAVPGMVPVSPSSSLSAPDVHHMAKHPGIPFPGRPASAPPFTLITAVPVRNNQPLRRLAMLRCGGAAVALPPLTAAADVGAARGAAADAASPRVSPKAQATGACKRNRADGDEHADDRCSTGGGVPAAGKAFPRPHPHDRMMDGFEYPPPFGPPPMAYYPCHPHHGCCYRPPHCMPPYPYRAMAPSGPFQLPPGCSSGGAGTPAAVVSSSFASTAPWSRPPTDGGMHAVPNRQPSVESPSQLDGCFPHPQHAQHPWQQSCGPWSGMCGMEGPWQGHPRGFSMCCPAGPGCPCGGRPDAAAMYYGRPIGPHGVARGGSCPMYMHPGVGHPVYDAPFPMEGWEAVPPSAGQPAGRHAAVKREGASGDGEACSSSVSDHQEPASDVLPWQPQEQGRWSPCSGNSGASPFSGHMPRMQPYPMGMMHPHGYPYPPPYYPPYGHAGMRGMVTVGSVTSMPSMAAAADDPMMVAAAGGARAMTSGRSVLPMPFVHPSAATQQQGTEADAGAGDADVAPYFNDAVGVSSELCKGKEAMVAPATAAEQQLPVVEGGDCGLGVEDGFAAVARESLDHDLAFAWENLVACDVTFESAMACH